MDAETRHIFFTSGIASPVRLLPMTQMAALHREPYQHSLDKVVTATANEVYKASKMQPHYRCLNESLFQAPDLNFKSTKYRSPSNPKV